MDSAYIEKICAVILAGGENHRMHGEKKAFLTLQGKSFLDHIAESFEDLLPVYLSVEEEAPYRRTGFPLIPDRYPGTGPLGGICSAMESCPEDAVFIAACDIPFLKKETVCKILDAYKQSPGKITLACQNGWIHPLLGIYPKSILPAVQTQIQEKEYRPRKLFDTQEVCLVNLEADDRSTVNINSPQEYAAQSGIEPLEIEDAAALLRTSVTAPEETESVELSQVLGRVLAEDITAQRDQPPFARSPLDGYALRAEDSSGADPQQPVTLQVIGKIYAGQTFDGRVGRGECVRLMTGAPIPEGADTVIRQEDTDYGEKEVQIFKAQKAYDNYCAAGDDFKKGSTLLQAGSRISAAAMAVAAGAGRTSLHVFRCPRVAVISTGDEILPAGIPLTAGKIYDTNLPYVVSRLAELGGTLVNGMHCADEADLMAQMLREFSQEHDLIITTGGVSVGEKDIMHAVAEKLGAQKLFWRVNLKPGAPTLAFLTEETLVICLTGNPYGVMVNFEMLVRPVLEKLSRGAVRPCRKEKRMLVVDSPKKANVRRFLKGIADGGEVRPAEGSQAAGTISTMAQCNCLIELQKGSTGKKGDSVWVYFL